MLVSLPRNRARDTMQPAHAESLAPAQKRCKRNQAHQLGAKRRLRQMRELIWLKLDQAGVREALREANLDDEALV
jgi:hypothetical protein